MAVADTFAPPLTVHHARGFAARLAGLLARPALRRGEALVLTPCRSVHTWFMPYPIDLVFADRAGRVLAVHDDVAPWRMVSCRGARVVLELRSGDASAYGFRAGAVLSDAVLGR